MKTEVKSETELNKIQSELSYLSSCVNAPKEYCDQVAIVTQFETHDEQGKN